ncbi:hypothetical protein [Burkholderia pyrrocinia]|uniref:hypothetical protein n=1 Tax=Burkholderia pyrrocinia TaxID=60550 RepID=UPI0030D334E9
MELFKNDEGYTPMLVNLAGHYAKDFASLEQKYQSLLLDGGITPEEWDRSSVARRRNIVAQRDYLRDPKHEAAIFFQLDVLRDDLAKMIASARSKNASDVALALRDVDDRIKEILDSDRVRDGELIQAFRNAKRQQNEPPSMAADRVLGCERLASMNLAAAKFWSNAQQSDRSTHPSNGSVERWLTERGFSESLARSAATIIRPDWAPTGRPPQER